MRASFPHFLWLLRDVSLKMTDREGKELEPTDFLHTRILASESGELTDLGKSLVTLFPSLESATLPIPSTKRNIICDIVGQQDKLKPAFNTAVDALIQQILQKVAPKIAVDGKTVTGKALAALAEGYVEAVNRPGALSDLDQGWQAVVRLELKEVSYRLVREYEREMEEALEGNLPMAERNLLRIHQQTLNRKKSALREEIFHVNPLHSSDEEVKPLLDQLEQDIVQWSQPSNNGERKLTGGVLYQFTTQNSSISKTHCERLFSVLLRKVNVLQQVQKALKDSEPLCIEEEVNVITTEYNTRAVGPAASEVLERGLSELSQLSDMLKKIPGPPRHVKVLGRSTDKVKLSWEPPLHNPEAVEEYVVYTRAGGGEWEEAVRTDRTKTLVKGLKSGQNYTIQVTATNSLIASIASRRRFGTVSSVKVASDTAEGAVAGAFGALVLPLVIGCAQESFSKNTARVIESKSKEYGLIALSIAALPVSIVLAPVTVPVLALVGASIEKKGCSWGDLTED